MRSPDDRAWVATRKGLFELRRDGGGWRHRARQLPRRAGDACCCRRDAAGPHARGAQPRPLRRQAARVATTPARAGSEVAAPAYPPQPEDATGPAWKLVQIWSLEAGAAARAVGRHPARRPVPLAPTAAHLAAGRVAVEPARARRMVRRRLRRAGHPFDLPASAATPASCWSASAAAASGSRATTAPSWALHGRAACAPTTCRPSRPSDPNIQDPHRIVALRRPSPTCSGASTTTASSARPTTPPAGSEVATAPLSSFGFAVAAHPHDADTAWFVPGVKRRAAGAGRRRARRSTAPATAAELRDPAQRPAAAADCYDLVYRHGLAVAPRRRAAC